ncbi:hypothetical protein EJB05_48173, partial [Eragrostis curvula]
MIPSRKEPLAAIALAVISLAAIAEPQPLQRPIALRGCPDKCGNISIPYPFGMAPGCFLDGFEVTCNNTFDPPRAFLASSSSYQQNRNGSYLSNGTTASAGTYWVQPVELIDITLVRGEARAYGAISMDCAINDTYHVLRRQATLFSSPFLFSYSRNVLNVIGWKAEAELTGGLYGTKAGDSVFCGTKLLYPSFAVNGSRSGLGCCEVNLTAGVGGTTVTFARMDIPFLNISPCSYGMVVERGWYSFSSEDLYGYQNFSRKHERDMRLAIAAESAEGLAYMHCKTNTNIQHGDVKPANILLDDNFVPKISDFGISKLLSRGTTEHADNVIGDNNYMDPVYRQTGLLTNKSDVYSFGLVLFELITGKKATYGGDSNFVKTYLDTYISGIRESQGKELFGEVNGAENDIEVVNDIVLIAKECLNNDVDQRPEMNDVAERLQNIRRERKK